MHILNLDIRDSSATDIFILVDDCSQWDQMLEVKDRLLQVLTPGGYEYVTVPFPSTGTMSISSIHLKLSSEIEVLADGLYQFHYSASPHTKLKVEYSHYRVSSLMSKVISKMAAIDYGDQVTLDACGTVMLTKLQNTLLHIWMQLKGAQAIGKESALVSKADEMYRQAFNEYYRLFHRNNR